MKIVLLLLTSVAFLSVCSLSAQNLSDTLYQKRPGAYLYYQHGKKIIMPNLVKVLKASPTAHEEYKKAQTSRFFSAIVGGAGGFLIGWSIGDLISGGKFNWTTAGIGAGLIVVNIPISLSDRKHTKNAVRIYNSELK